MRPIDGYLTISQAAKLVGVTPATLRNWERDGRLMPKRNPMNGYRLYKREDIEHYLQKVAKTGETR